MVDHRSSEIPGWTRGQGGIDEDWDEFVGRMEDGHHAQTSRWGLVQSHRGWDVDRLLLTGEGEQLAGAQILSRSVARFGRVAYLDRGPLITAGRPDLTDSVIDALRRFSRERRIDLMIVQPPDHAHLLGAAMRNSGFGPSHIKMSLPATTVLDLRQEPDALLAGMKSKTRYNIRLGLRSGITVRRGDRSDVAVFHRMLEQTASRQGFVPNRLDYLLDLYETLGSWCEVFVAEYEGQAVAGLLAMTFGDTVVYKRGAWSGEEGNRRPNEVMHWEAIKWANAHGFKRYDFDGIEPDIARSVLAGEKVSGAAADSVTRFKLGFGGEVLLLPEASTYLPNRIVRLGHDRVYPRLASLRVMKRLVKRMRVA